jgi:hypothetical protein
VVAIPVKEAALVVSEDDDDEFKSAESKTPPKERSEPIVEKVQIMPYKVDSDTVTEHSSDDEFLVTRPVAVAASLAKNGVKKHSNTNSKVPES